MRSPFRSGFGIGSLRAVGRCCTSASISCSSSRSVRWFPRAVMFDDYRTKQSGDDFGFGERLGVSEGQILHAAVRVVDQFAGVLDALDLGEPLGVLFGSIRSFSGFAGDGGMQISGRRSDQQSSAGRLDSISRRLLQDFVGGAQLFVLALRLDATFAKREVGAFELLRDPGRRRNRPNSTDAPSAPAGGGVASSTAVGRSISRIS